MILNQLYRITQWLILKYIIYFNQLYTNNIKNRFRV